MQLLNEVLRFLKEKIKWIRIGAVVSAVVIVLIGFFLQDWKAQRFVIFYIAPLIAAVLLWSSDRIEKVWLVSKTRFALDCIVVAFSFARFLGFFPFSGHMLFLIYSGATTQWTAYRIIAVILILETTYFKLLIWNDSTSWLLGTALGIVSAIIYFRFPSNSPNTSEINS